MNTRFAFIMDPLTATHPEKDTTLAMIRAAIDAGIEVWIAQNTDFMIQNDALLLHCQAVTHPGVLNSLPEVSDRQIKPLSTFDTVLMRSDPPVNAAYVTALQCLVLAQKQGLRVVNRPESLLHFNEKLLALYFPNLCPSALVSAHKSDLKSFLQTHQNCVIKPLDAMGGTRVFHLRHDDDNQNVIIETLTEHGQQSVMIQRYIPEIKMGDKRIILINGETPDFLLARIPNAHDLRGNLAAGATPEVRPLSARDKAICENLSPWLKSHGLSFVGIDVIGDYLTEINITSPTGVIEIEKQTNVSLARKFIEFLLSSKQT